MERKPLYIRLRFRIKNTHLVQFLASFANWLLQAFNSIKRNDMLKTVCSSMPVIDAFTNFCYSQHSQLLYDKFVVSSESGIQQGKPLGPLLFSLTLWPIIEKIQDYSPELQQISWFLDNGVLVGSEHNLIRTWDLLCLLGPDLGLQVRVYNCSPW